MEHCICASEISDVRRTNLSPDLDHSQRHTGLCDARRIGQSHQTKSKTKGHILGKVHWLPSGPDASCDAKKDQTRNGGSRRCSERKRV